MGTDAVAQKYDVIRRHCDDVGRDYADIQKTILMQVDLVNESVDQVVEKLGTYAAIGTDHALFAMRNAHEPGSFDKVPDLVRQAEGLAVAGRS